MDPRFHYVLVIPDHEPEDFTPFQGLSPGLMGFEWALHLIARLPTDLFEPALARPARIARRIAGTGSYLWRPMNETVLPHLLRHEDDPIWVFLSQDDEVARRIEAWRGSFDPLALHVSAADITGPLSPPELTRTYLRRHARRVVRARVPEPDKSMLLDALARWAPLTPRASPLTFRSHNVTAANEMVMGLDGVRPRGSGPHINPRTDEDYIRAIEESAGLVRRMRLDAGDVPAFRAYPPKPDTIVFAPAMYRHAYGRLGRPDATESDLRETMKHLREQSGYAFRSSTGPGAIGTPAWVYLMGLRSQELGVLTGGVGLYAASNIAAAIRLPAGVNRVQSAISQLASHIRAHPETDRKTERVFGAVQNALAQAVAPSLIDLMAESRTGIKLFADAPLEWLSIDGLPLSLRHEVSRLNATPGNLAFGELINAPHLMVRPSAFQEVLVLSSFSANDPIRDHMQAALNLVAPGAGFTVRLAQVSDLQTFKDALNNFTGALAVFDGHGRHDPVSGVGALLVGDEALSVWDLRGQVRIPPIMILSACDTHALDQSHATVGNALLACGARAVLATLLPVRSQQSAALVARLLHRATALTALINRTGRAVTWAEVVTGILRTQLISDVFVGLNQAGVLDRSTAMQLTVQCGNRVALREDNWWEDLKADAAEATGWSADRLEQHLRQAIARSDVVRYVHLGGPETIIISDQAILDRLNSVRPQVLAPLADRPTSRRRRR